MQSRHFMTGAYSLALALCLSSVLAVNARAGSRSYADVKAASYTSNGAPSVQRVGESPVSQKVTIPYGKSVTVDLPNGFSDVVVASPRVLDALVHTSSRILLVGKQVGQTNAFFYGQDGRELLVLEVRVERDVTDLMDLIARHAPGAENVEVKMFNNNLLLTGVVPDASTAKTVEKMAGLWLNETAPGTNDLSGTVTNLMTIKGNDLVQLKVRIVEMQRSVTKQMGIDFNVLGQIGDASIGLIGSSALSGVNGFNGNVNWTNSGGGSLKSLSSNLRALEKVGLVRTLAEPVLTAISGETANFLSGGEFPLLTNVFVDDNGQIQREFEYKPFGVSLGFTPVVLSEGRISLNISTEVSEPTTEGAFQTTSGDVLGLRVRRANSVVELPAGGSMVIAGLIREESRQSTEGTPGLKDVPGLGALFRTRDDETTETELVIIVTPYLVNSTHPDNLQTPLDGFIAANDHQSTYLGRINKVYGKNAKNNPNVTLTGPFGHVVD